MVTLCRSLIPLESTVTPAQVTDPPRVHSMLTPLQVTDPLEFMVTTRQVTDSSRVQGDPLQVISGPSAD